MRLKFTLIGLLFGLSIASAFAQDNYTPGKIYSSGDTLTGYINSQQTARYVKFKAGDGSVMEYAPNQIGGFEREGVVYVSKEAVTNPYGEKIKEPLFMEQLVWGKISLYYYKERDNEKHYWVEKGGEMIELQGGRKVVTVNQVKYQKEDKTYQIFLQQLFSDCHGKSDLHLCAFNKKSLSQAVYEYNLCVGEASVRNQSRKEKLKVHPGIRIGGSYFSEASSAYRLTPSIGAFVNIPLAGANRLLSGQFEVNYNQYRTTEVKVIRQYSFVDLVALFRVTHSKGIVRPFGAVGVAYGVGLKEVRSGVTAKYVSGKGGLPRLVLESGIQVPLGKRFIYTAARYEKFINTPKGYYKLFSFSLGMGF